MSRWVRAAAATGVLLLAGAGQLALERARANASRPPVLAAIAFAGAAGLAVAALRQRGLLPVAPSPLEPPRFNPALYAACIPGIASLIFALRAHVGASAPGDHRRAVGLWILGLILILLPGLVDWLRNLRQQPPGSGGERLRFAVAALVLFVFAFAVRTWGGIDRIPAWVENDEATTGIGGRMSLSEGPQAVFAFWDMGMPRMALFVSQIAARPFGQGLRGLRLGSALMGSLSVVLLFDFGRRLIGAGPAFLAALLLAVNHTHVHWSRVGQVYIETPFFAGLVLALLLRVITGGSFLALVGAGIALGIGAATYQPTQILPGLVGAALVGWALILRWPLKRTFGILAFVGAVTALTCAPMAVTLLRIPRDVAFHRLGSISLLRREGPRALMGHYGVDTVNGALREHALRTISIFNFGSDYFPSYGADRSLTDAFTAALVPVAFVLLLSRLLSPLGWLCTLFTGAYLLGGVFLFAHPPTFHRIPVILFFSSLGVAWTVVGLSRALAAPASKRRWLPAVAAFALAGASAWSNLHYYFRELPQTRLMAHTMELGNLICRYASSRTVIDATVLDGIEYAPPHNVYPEFQCPGAKWIRVSGLAQLWQFPNLTDAQLVVLIVPAVVEAANPGQPRGYRLTRRYVDTTIRRPVALPLTVLEYERTP